MFICAARRAARMVLLISYAIIVQLVQAVTSPAMAQVGPPTAKFDPTTTEYRFYRDQTAPQFDSTVSSHKGSYFIADLDVDVSTVLGTQAAAFGAAWQKNPDGRTWRVRYDMSGSDYGSEHSAQTAAGMRLVDQQTYVLNGVRRWAAVWIKNTEAYAWGSRRDLNGAGLVERMRAMQNGGYVPVDIDQHVSGGSIFYNLAWVKNAENRTWKLEANLTSSGFATKHDSYKATMRLVAFDVTNTADGPRYAGIWVGNDSGRKWIALRDMSSRTAENNYRRYDDMGYRVVGYNRYDTASGPRYQHIFRQNSTRPDWPFRTQVDQRIQAEVTNTALPGMSVAVWQNGVPVYLRGFGHANVGKGEWLDSKHVLRLASVSKAVASVLTYRLQEVGYPFVFGQRADYWVPELPAHHTETIGQLVSSRGCVRHYASEHPNHDFTDLNGETQYDTAFDAAEAFWDDELVCRPGTYSYSTHGYTILGAVLELIVGAPVSDIVVSKLTTPFSLNTLRPEDPSRNARRAQIYNDDNSLAQRDNLSWKVLGGGLESSVYDLSRFGELVRQGRIIPKARLQAMWTRPASTINDDNYAYGWNVGTRNGFMFAGKTGSQLGARSYLMIYPDAGLVIAVLSNRDEGGHNPLMVAVDISDLIL